MRKIIILLAVLAVCYAFKPVSPVCSAAERKPGPCAQIYHAVCAIQTVNGQTEYADFSNRCFACKDANTTLVIDGTCDAIPKGASFCLPQKAGEYFCPDVWQPVCGYYKSHIQCIKAPCAVTLSNSCYACLNPDIAYYVKGSCEGDDLTL